MHEATHRGEEEDRRWHCDILNQREREEEILRYHLLHFSGSLFFFLFLPSFLSFSVSVSVSVSIYIY